MLLLTRYCCFAAGCLLLLFHLHLRYRCVAAGCLLYLLLSRLLLLLRCLLLTRCFADRYRCAAGCLLLLLLGLRDRFGEELAELEFRGLVVRV